jgi:hypothetical protein
VEIVANAERERGHNAATAFPVYLDEEPSLRRQIGRAETRLYAKSLWATTPGRFPLGIRTRVFGHAVPGVTVSCSKVAGKLCLAQRQLGQITISIPVFGLKAWRVGRQAVNSRSKRSALRS